jgi:hypothetical protein
LTQRRSVQNFMEIGKEGGKQKICCNFFSKFISFETCVTGSD